MAEAKLKEASEKSPLSVVTGRLQRLEVRGRAEEVPEAALLGPVKSFGLTLIGGLTTSTLLTLLVIPVFYTFFDDARILVGASLRRVLGRGGELFAGSYAASLRRSAWGSRGWWQSPAAHRWQQFRAPPRGAG